MNDLAGFITDPRKMLEFPFVMMEAMGTFVTLIMQESFKFATQIGRLVV